MAIRFHLDEHIDPAIASGLRRRGIDVTTAVEAGLVSATDKEHLELALAEGRVIVTQDADYLRYHYAGVDHAGIAYTQKGLRTIGELLRNLILIHDCLTAEEMRRHLEYL